MYYAAKEIYFITTLKLGSIERNRQPRSENEKRGINAANERQLVVVMCKQKKEREVSRNTQPSYRLNGEKEGDIFETRRRGKCWRRKVIF